MHRCICDGHLGYREFNGHLYESEDVYPIKRGCSSTKLVQNDKAAIRRSVQNLARLRHLHHKRRPSARQIIRSCTLLSPNLSSSSNRYSPPILVNTESSKLIRTASAGT